MMSFFLSISITFLLGVSFLSRGPLLLAVLIVLLSIMTGGLLMLSVSSWLMLAMIMLYVGGMMILFFYLISLAHMKKSTLNFSSMWLIIFLLVAVMSPTSLSAWFFAGSLYNVSSLNILLLVVIFLLASLVLVSKMLKFFKSSMKIVFND